MRKLQYVILFVFILGIPLMVKSQGCMESGSDEGVTVAGFFQPQYEYIQHEGADNESTFTFERARFGFLGSIPYDVSYYAFIETSAFKSDNPFLLDAFITYSRFKNARISIGQFKSPISLELNTPCHKLHTIKRSRVVTDLASPDRVMGLMVSGGGDSTLFKYSVGLLNGTGIGTTDDNTKKDIAARLVVQPFSFLSFGGSFKYGESKPISDTLDDDKTTRIGGEIQFKYNNWLVQGEYIMGSDDGSYTTGSACNPPIVTHIGEVNRNGYFIMAMYMTPWNIQPVIKYESYEPDTDTKYDQMTVLTFGINYFLNDWTRIQVNYLYSAEEFEIDNDQLLVQVQVNF
ncbi:porin [Bacteroidota bacterium]